MSKKRFYINNVLLLAVLYLIISQAFHTSCANQGMPSGGLRDSLPPILVSANPSLGALNFSGKDVRLTFNEYIIADAVAEELVISPPLEKRASVRTRSKTLIVSFDEALKPDVTYSLDFKNSVVDNNERNPYIGLRMTFSTGGTIDTLRVAGMVKNAFTLDPIGKMVVMLYENLEDTAIVKTKPDYIAKTDDKGIFLFDNIKTGKYKLYAINDVNRNLRYEAGIEEIAFADSIIIPSAEFKAGADTLLSVSGVDSLMIIGSTYFYPDPVYLRVFTESVFDQYVKESLRDIRHRLQIVFNEPVDDTLGIKLLNSEIPNWYLLEHNQKMDSLMLWVTDTLVAKLDTMKIELLYTQLDSMKNRVLERDTVSLIFKEKETQKPDQSRRRQRNEEEEKPETVQFAFRDNIKSPGFDLNLPILITSPEPVQFFDLSAIKLYLAEDLTNEPIAAAIVPDSSLWRTWRIDTKWQPDTGYILEIDSAACVNIFGVTSRKLKKQFTTQKDDFYGRIILNLTSITEPMLVQLLDNSREEKVLETQHISSDGKVIFDFLPPVKYKIKVIYDSNKNGKWDTGSFSEKRQPERIAYLPEIIKIRSNWDNEFHWDLKPDPTFYKVLVDKEEEELKRRKEAEERQRQEEQENEPQSTPLNFGGGFQR